MAKRDDVPNGEELSILNRSGFSMTELAQLYSCSRMTIKYRIESSGNEVIYFGSTHRQNILPDARIIQVLLKRLSIGDIAKRYGVSEVAVYGKFKRSGLEMLRPAKQKHLHLPPDGDLLSEYESSKVSTRELAQKYGVSQGTICVRLREARKVRYNA